MPPMPWRHFWADIQPTFPTWRKVTARGRPAPQTPLAALHPHWPGRHPATALARGEPRRLSSRTTGKASRRGLETCTAANRIAGVCQGREDPVEPMPPKTTVPAARGPSRLPSVERGPEVWFAGKSQNCLCVPRQFRKRNAEDSRKPGPPQGRFRVSRGNVCILVNTRRSIQTWSCIVWLGSGPKPDGLASRVGALLHSRGWPDAPIVRCPGFA